VQVVQPVWPAVEDILPAPVEYVPTTSTVSPITATKPPQPQTPLVRREIRAPTGAMKDEAFGSVASFKHATVNADGTRVLTVSEREIICWDVATGKTLQTFRRGNHWKTPTFAAPDARTVVVFDRDKKALQVKNAETGGVVGTYAAKKDLLAHHAGVPGFTAQSDEFIFTEALERHTFNVHALSTRTGAVRTLARAMRSPGPKGDRDPHDLFPVPGRSTVLTHLSWDDGGKPPRSVYALELGEKRSWPVHWVTERQPGIHFPGQGLRFSPDGGRLAFRQGDGVTLADWPTGGHEAVFAADGAHRYKQSPAFTPDRKRLVVLDLWDRAWQIIHFGGSGPSRGNDRLQLIDLTTNTKIADVDEQEFSDEHGLGSGLALSGNGKVLVLCRADCVWVVDFQRAFGVAP
jgi:hypothetical protein